MNCEVAAQRLTDTSGAIRFGSELNLYELGLNVAAKGYFRQEVLTMAISSQA